LIGGRDSSSPANVTLPQTHFSLASAPPLSFLTSFNEVTLAPLIAGGSGSTLTRNMFNALRDQIDPTIAATSTLMISVTTPLLVVPQFYGP
jgi:putative spermidine/putrescine transport system permease protein